MYLGVFGPNGLFMLPSIHRSDPPCTVPVFGVLLYVAVLLPPLFHSLLGSLSEAPVIMHYAPYRESLLSVWEDTSESQAALGAFSMLHSWPDPANLYYLLTGGFLHLPRTDFPMTTCA